MRSIRGKFLVICSMSLMFATTALASSYVNDTIGISFDIPDEWVSEISGNSVVFSGTEGSEEWNTTLSLQYVKGSYTIEALANDLLKQWRKEQKYQKLQDRQLQLNGLQARNIVVEYNSPGTSDLFKQNQVIIDGGGKFYLIGYTAPARLYSKHLSKLDDSMQSLVIRDTANAPKTETAQVSSTPSDAVQDIADTLELIIGSIQMFRETCAARGIVCWEEYGSKEVVNSIQEANSMLWAGLDPNEGWQYIFSLSSVMINKLETGEPVVGFYHPWSDTWVITDWKLTPDGFSITSVELLTGAWMRQKGQPPFELTPDWLRKDFFPAESLAQSYSQNLDVFERVVYSPRSWRKELQLDKNHQLLLDYNYTAYATNILASWYIAMEFYQQDSPSSEVPKLREGVEKFLTAGSEAKLQQILSNSKETPAIAKKQILDIPAEEFSLFTPIYWRADKTDSVAFLAHAGNPELLLSLYFASGWSSVELQRADLISLQAVRASQRQK